MRGLTQFDELDTPPIKEPQLTQSSADGRWNLPEPAFLRWWRALAEEDRAEFVGVYGGDSMLARFVCALDYLTTMNARPQSGQTIVEAYSIAAEIPPESDDCKRLALICWQHDAVQALIDRLRYRSSRQAAARITNRATLLIEQTLKEASSESIEDKTRAINSAMTFLKMVSATDIQERVERTRRGFVKARQELTAKQEEIEDVTPEQARLYVEILREKIGTEELLALASGDATK